MTPQIAGGSLAGPLLAIDLRRRKAGFVVFERIGQLLDWGVRAQARDRDLLHPITKLLDYYRPRVVVVRRATKTGMRQSFQRLRAAATARAIAIEIVSAEEASAMFAEFDCRNKHEINLLLARWFNELTWKLPPKRKPWQPERHTQSIFDATAAAMTYIMRDSPG